VDDERHSLRAISRTPALRTLISTISSRSSSDRYRPDSGTLLTSRIPPASRNHRDPTGCDTPTLNAACSLETPSAINPQNVRRCSRRHAGGQPGEPIAVLPVTFVVQPFGRPIHTPPRLRCCDDRLNPPCTVPASATRSP